MGHEPVRNAGTLSAALITLSTAIVAWLSAMGYVRWDNSQQAITVALVTAIVDIGAILVPMFWANRQVTPLSAPKNKMGQPLYSAAQFQAMMQAEPPKAPAVPRREGVND